MSGVDTSEGTTFWHVTPNWVHKVRAISHDGLGGHEVVWENDDGDRCQTKVYEDTLFKLSDIEGVRQRMREIIGTARAELVKFEELHGIGQTYSEFVNGLCSSIHSTLELSGEPGRLELPPESFLDRIERITTVDSDIVIDMKNPEPHCYARSVMNFGGVDPHSTIETHNAIMEIKSLRTRATSIKPIIALPWGTVWFHYLDLDGKVIGTTVCPPGGSEMICASVSEESPLTPPDNRV